MPTAPPDGMPARAALEEEAVAQYRRLLAAITASHAPEFAALDITMAQMKALYLVASRGELHITALADLMGVTLSTGSGLVDRLVDAGLLDRQHAAHDRRQVLVSLTAEGVALVERVRELSTPRVASLLHAIDDADLVALARVLASFASQLEANR